METSNVITAREIKKLMISSYKKYHRGTISETQAYRENVMLANILKAVESSEQEERLEKLEQALLMGKDE